MSQQINLPAFQILETNKYNTSESDCNFVLLCTGLSAEVQCTSIWIYIYKMNGIPAEAHKNKKSGYNSDQSYSLQF